MSVNEDGFNAEEFLTHTEFTIPVVLEEPKVHVGTTPKKRTIMVTYSFDDAKAEIFAAGRWVDEPALERPIDGTPVPAAKQVKKALALNEQLNLLVTKLNDKPTSEETWPKMVFKYRQEILKKILEDIYPNAKISMG